jgi:hypothetical protein
VNPPGGVGQWQWAYVVSADGKTSPQIRDETLGILAAYPQAFVAINEIKASTVGYIAEAANLIGPGYANRWGAYVVNGAGVNYSSGPIAGAIGAVFANHGRVMPEFYPRYVDYYNAATTDAARDSWLNTTWFNGPGRLGALVALKPGGSQSRIHPIFSASNPVHHPSASEATKARWVDRIMYVFCKSSGYRSLFLASNAGGAGSYLWAGLDTSSWGCSSAVTDSNFASLWVRYAVTAATPVTPNWSGPMPAPAS